MLLLAVPEWFEDPGDLIGFESEHFTPLRKSMRISTISDS
jgi:hypothetical protein